MWRLNSQFRASIFRDSTLFADDNICHEQPVPKITDDQASTAVAQGGNLFANFSGDVLLQGVN